MVDGGASLGYLSGSQGAAPSKKKQAGSAEQEINGEHGDGRRLRNRRGRDELLRRVTVTTIRSWSSACIEGVDIHVPAVQNGGSSAITRYRAVGSPAHCDYGAFHIVCCIAQCGWVVVWGGGQPINDCVRKGGRF